MVTEAVGKMVERQFLAGTNQLEAGEDTEAFGRADHEPKSGGGGLLRSSESLLVGPNAAKPQEWLVNPQLIAHSLQWPS